jgi:hypothetical protein
MTTPLPEADKQSLIARYEQLRKRVLSGRIQEMRDGLAVLLQKGMAAWMEVCLACRQTITKKCLTPIDDALPNEQYGALIDLFVNMALNRIEEVLA